MEKIVVLNSGGFDSVVLLNYAYTVLEEKGLYSLHFKYGAKNEEQQLSCVNKVCDKLGISNKVITLPPIDWTKSSFFNSKPDYDTEEEERRGQYLEYRNMIFISYALSYAEAIGAKKIYVAFLGGSPYVDCSLDLIQGINHFAEPHGIVVDAPFIFDNKTRLGHIAKYLGVTDKDYFSCDFPFKSGEPCGSCLDCLALKEIYKKIY